MSIKLIMPDMATKLEKTKRKLNKKIVKALVEMIPDNIEYLTWDQYTPYFNDGDTCRFYVCEASFVAANGDEYGQYGDKHDYDNILRDIDIITDDDNKDIYAKEIKILSKLPKDTELDYLLKVRRDVDMGDDLWNTYNVVQENVMRGDFGFGLIEPQLNERMWETTEQFAQLLN